MNGHKTKKHFKKPLYSLETNILKHKRTSKGGNQINKTNIMIPPCRSLLTREELDHLWIKYHTHGHFRDENSELIKEKSQNQSKNGDKTEENFTNRCTQSIRIMSTNTWNWAQVTEINQSNRSLNEVNSINFSNDTSDIYDFAKILINQEWLQEKKTLNLSATETNGSENCNNSDSIYDSYSEILQPSQHKSTNHHFDQDSFKENMNPNIFSDFKYSHYHKRYDYGLNNDYSTSHGINLNQNNDKTTNNNYWFNGNRKNFSQSLGIECNEFDNLTHTIPDNQNELNSNTDALLEYFSL